MDDNGYKPFEILKKSCFKPQKSKARKSLPVKGASSREESGSVVRDEVEMFRRAMHGVVPLDKAKGRAVYPDSSSSARGFFGPDPEVLARERLKDIVQGRIEFELDLSGEYVQGRVVGLDYKIFHRLKQGRFSVQAHLDLHGLNAVQAYEQVVAFIRGQYQSGGRCILLVTGRGKNSPEGFGVLREKIQGWLTREPLRRVVLAFVTARPEHGGAGALYVLLRRFKKSQGKVRWDRNPSDREYW